MQILLKDMIEDFKSFCDDRVDQASEVDVATVLVERLLSRGCTFEVVGDRVVVNGVAYKQ